MASGLNPELESELQRSAWGCGVATHLPTWPDRCPRCRGVGYVGSPNFPLVCPQCQGVVVDG